MAVVAVHIGTSGWSYAHWTNILYPEGLPPERRLDHYVRQFHTVELNASYYRWPPDSAFASWQRRLPDGFLVGVKAPGALTHAKRLYGPEAWLARICEGLHRLGSKRGVLLVQLPASSAVDHPRLAYFLERVPRGLRISLEFRNPTWLQDSTYRGCSGRRTAFCCLTKPEGRLGWRVSRREVVAGRHSAARCRKPAGHLRTTSVLTTFAIPFGGYGALARVWRRRVPSQVAFVHSGFRLLFHPVWPRPLIVGDSAGLPVKPSFTHFRDRSCSEDPSFGSEKDQPKSLSVKRVSDLRAPSILLASMMTSDSAKASLTFWP